MKALQLSVKVIVRCVVAVLVIGLSFGASRKYFKLTIEKPTIERTYFDMRRDADLVRISWAEGTDLHLHCLRGDQVTVRVRTENRSPFALTSSSEPRSLNQPINIAFRYFRPEDDKIEFESTRTYLERPLMPGVEGAPSIAELNVNLPCPNEIRKVRVKLALVQEAVGWQFEYSQTKTWAEAELVAHNPITYDQIPIHELTGSQAIMRTIKLNDAHSNYGFHDVSKIAAGILGLTMARVHVGGLNYLVNNAGSQYPQIWLRDFASVQKALFATGWRLATGEGHWLDLFLTFQHDDGQLDDWIMLSPNELSIRRAKNDVQSDQELWAIIAAGEALEAEVMNVDWLEGRIQGRSRRERLHAALEWILNQRFDQQKGCLWSGHVADWGDVGLSGHDEATSTKLTHGHPRVCGIFLQGLLSKALESAQKNLGITTVSFKGQNTNLQEVKDTVRNFAQTELWSNQYQHFVIHQHIDEFQHAFDEAAIFALGGNLWAIDGAIADERQARSLLAKIIELQKKMQLPTVGFVLMPPYPANTFENPIMDQEFEYQNGGDWDWYGIRAAAMIGHINPVLSKEKLREIAEKIVSQGTFYEWNPQSGSPVSGEHFRGGAAEWLSALFGKTKYGAID